jgi:general secretion pathway protein L
MAVLDVLAAGLGKPAARLRARWFSSPLPAWFDAWLAALLLWLPERWRAVLRSTDSRLWLLPAGDGNWTLRSGNDQDGYSEIAVASGSTLSLTQWPLDRARWLLLPAPAVLRRELRLPLAAADRLRDLLRHQIDRETPFTADQVAFDARVLGRDDSGKQIRVALVVLPLATLNTHVAAANAIGGGLRGVDVANKDGHPLGLNLLPSTQREHRRDPTVQLNLLLLAISVIALFYAGWQSLDNRREAVAALTAEVETQRTAARQSAALRKRLDDAVEGASFLAQARSERPRVIDLLNDLSERLPDGTWLERLNIADRRVIVVGYSDQASALVARLQQSPHLGAPALAGSLQPDPRSGRDRFTITAEATISAGGAKP